MSRKHKQKIKKVGLKSPEPRRELSLEELRRAGAEAFRAGNYHEAVVNWSTACQREPSDALARQLAEAYFRRSLTFYPEDKLEQVISDLHWAVKLSPRSPMYHYHLGLAYHRRRNFAKALTCYGQALELAPEINRYRYHFGLACIDGDMHVSAAQQMFAALAAAEPGNVQWKYPLAVIYLKQGEWEKAAVYLEDLHAQAGDSAPVNALLGLAHLQRGDPSPARPALEQAVERLSAATDATPGAKRALGLTLHYLGLAQAQVGDLAAAHQSWERASNLGFRSSQLEANLAMARQIVGARALREGRLAEAVRYWEQAAASSASDKDTKRDLIHLYFLYAHQLAEEGRLEEAAEYYEKVAEAERSTEILHNLALTYDRLNRPEKSVTYWQRVIKDWDKQFRGGGKNETLRRNLNEAYKHLGKNCLRIGQDQRACRELERALYYLPGDVETRKALAEAHLSARHLREAIETLEQLIEEHPDDVDALVNLGVAYDMNGEEEDALDAWEGALEIQPEHAFARQQISVKIDERVQILLMMNRFDDAIQELETKLELLSDDAETRCQIGGLYLSRKQERRAREYFERAHRAAPQNEEVALLIGSQYLRFGYEKAAEDWFDRAEDLKPDDPDVLVRIGIYYLRAEREDLADDYFQDAVELAGDDKSIPRRIAIRFYNEGYPEEAIEYLEKTVEVDPTDARALHLLARCYAEVEEYDVADDLLDRAEEEARKQGLRDLLEAIEYDRDFGWGADEEEEDEEFF